MRRPLAYFPWLFAVLLCARSGQAHTLRLAIPVVWQLTRTHLLGPGAPSMTESFRETWTLEMSASGLLNLTSPRARVPVYGAGAQGLHDPLPHVLAVTEIDFARLVGAQPAVPSELEDNESSAVQRPIILHIGKPPRAGSDINLVWSEEEHFAVHFDIGTNALY